MEPLTGEVFRMPHETELWDTHVLFYRHRIFFFTVMRLLFWPSVGPVLYRLCGRRNVCILMQKSLVRDFTMFALPVELRRRNWQFAWDWQAACQPHGEWRTQLLHWLADRTVLHPPCQHGLSSDGQRAKQGGSQKWSSEHYFGAVYDCEENLIVLCVWKWQNRDTTCPLRCKL